MRSFFPLACAAISAVAAQLLKIVFMYFKTGKFTPSWAFSAGGFPSSHSSTVVSLSLAIGMQEGFDSALFAVTAVFSCLVMYDACHVRYYSGKNIALTQQLIEDIKGSGTVNLDKPLYLEKLKTVLGHNKMEVAGGVIVGLIVPFLLAPLFVIFQG
jgi:hypothetical protein